MVQSGLAARNPRRTPPRIVSGPILLTGLAKRGSCGCGMTIRTGKSGRYRYYTCAGHAQKGKTLCKGRSIAMQALDGVTEHLIDQLFTPDRLRTILHAYIEKSAETDVERNRRLSSAKQRLTDIGGKIARLLELVAKGLMETDGPELANQLTSLKAQRTQMAAEVELLQRVTSTGSVLITDEKLNRFAEVMREALRQGDIAFRRAYIRLFVDEIVLSDSDICLSGPKDALARSASTGTQPPTGGVVPSFVRKWRAKCHESNNWNTLNSL
jgi:site-specific DNA recombinase